MRREEYIDISDVKMPEGLPKINFYKKPKYFEIAVPLFERCNLHCSFCFEAHEDNRIDYEKILAMPKKIIEQTKKQILACGTNQILLRLWGGELFFDALPDDIFGLYRDFLRLFEMEVERELPGKKIDVTYLSNGVFTKYGRVDRLLDDTNGRIAFSYDPEGRFNTVEQKTTWLKTLRHFKDRTRYISITLTKQSIDAYLAGDEFFDQIPDDISIDINYYTANPNWKKHMPTDDDIFRFYKWCVDHKRYNVRVMDNIFRYLIPGERDYVERYCDCKQAVQFQDGQAIRDCARRASTLSHNLFYGGFEKDVTEDNVTEVKNVLGLQKRGCLTCEHYEHCTMPCWVAIMFQGYKTVNCPLKRIYTYIKPEDIKEFAKWKETHDLG